MSSVVNADIEANGGFSANRWTKDGERGLADRVYVDAPGGVKVGYYDLVKNTWVMDKNNRSVQMGIIKEKDSAKVSITMVGREPIHIGERTVLLPHEGPIFGQGTNLAKDFLVSSGQIDDMSIGDFFEACMAGGEAWLTMHRRKFN